MALLNTWASQQDQATLSPLSRLLNNYIQQSDAPLAYLMRGDAQGLLKDLNTPKPVNTTRDMTDLALNLNPVMGLIGATAFQGSPKLFDKFDKSKIGTAGGLDFGYGGYFSESPSVASKYMGSDDKFITTVNNEVMDTPILKSIIRMGGDPKSLVKTLQDKLKSQKQALSSASKEEVLPGISDYDIAKIDYDSTLNKINEAKSYIGKKIDNRPAGNLYKVDIPDETLPYYLNWDSAKQTPQVQSLLEQAGLYRPNATGQDLYLSAIDKAGSSDAQKSGFQKASEYLNSLGIKGNTYIDRTYDTVAKNPTNYVVYDPETIKILERNGILVNK